ncbi:DoxX family protein [Lacibacter sediminis]|uniref:DoxX family protein n=1 Tax=Lacibacter sediminis TaxID=2760713 RepID=A0A7G5XKW1_9BACT|nr:DoxX family protein [Lacibacter sediminis]QNA46114.1 DoxX family protein [Lacibacter sediminis]
MGMLHQLQQWSITHHPKWLVILRVALGFSLILKGISFISNNILLQDILLKSNLSSQGWLSTAIPWLHLLGGALIVVGLFTRWAVLMQVPILIGAIFFVNAKQGVFSGQSELGLSLVILALLIFFFAEGGGPLSLDDHYFRKKKS